MKHYKISEQQLQQVGNFIAECPAKYVFGAIDILRKVQKQSLETETAVVEVAEAEEE